MAGFTLLELLVAIVILTIVMTVALSSRSYEAGIERADAGEELRSAANFLRRQFAQLMPISTDMQTKQFAFAGTSSHIRFVASAPRHPVAAGLIVYSLTADGQNTDTQRLMLSYGWYDPGADDLHEADFDRQLILADDLTSIAFQYFGTKEATQSRAAWYDVWSEDEYGLPELVRISLNSANDDGRWPDLILQIRVEEQS
jgi:prepilin-type N-terminal cleavage/methylation domain-containing protein